jgi:hypothetical protein
LETIKKVSVRRHRELITDVEKEGGGIVPPPSTIIGKGISYPIVR